MKLHLRLYDPGRVLAAELDDDLPEEDLRAGRLPAFVWYEGSGFALASFTPGPEPVAEYEYRVTVPVPV